MIEHRCVHRFPIRHGVPYTPDQCFHCWSALNGARHAVVANVGPAERGHTRGQQPGGPRDERVGVSGIPDRDSPRSVRVGVGGTRPLPCVHEGPILHPCPAGHDHLHVRECREDYGRTTRQRCGTCADYQPAPEPIHFHLSAHGIGDAVVGLYAACGLADTGRHVVFHCRQSHWLAGVSHPGVTVQPWAGTDHGHDANADYGGQLRAGSSGTCSSRGQWYADRIAHGAGVPQFTPSRPQTVARPDPVLARGYVLVAPFAAWGSRNWPHFPELVRRMSGRRVVVIGSRKQYERLTTTFGGMPSTVSWHWGMPPEWVLSAVTNADHVYGNDSGIPHLAGLHGVPTTAVVSHLTGSFLFGESPSVRAVSPDQSVWPCSPCGWQRGRGYTRSCDAECKALTSIDAGRVPLPVLPQHELNRTLHVREQSLIGAGECW